MNSGDRIVVKKEVEKILKYKDLAIYIYITNVEGNNQSNTSKNRGNCIHLKIIKKIRKQHNGKARNQGTTENNHTWHYTYFE